VGHGLALVVADAGRDAGLGHISRSSAIALALGQLGLETRCLALGAEAPLERDGVRWEPLPRLDEAPLAEASVLVLDSYRSAAPELGALPGSVPLVVLQEHLPPPARAALVVSAGAEPGDGDPRRLRGLEYVSLRPAFWSAPRREVAGRVRRVLVTTGAGDPVPGLGPKLAAAARDALPAAAVTLVRGPFAAGSPPAGVELLDAPESLRDALLEADVVVTAGGQTLLEAAALGTPAIAVVAVENQRAQTALLAARGAVLPLELPADGLSPLLQELDASPQRRRELAANAQAAVDGRGARRVAERIAALL
jgi:spore coat polysaccharide biosynthesis predicted glycosyltransferase SpsG